MNDKEYEQVKQRYIRFTDEEFSMFMRQHAFEELDAQVEVIFNNESDEVCYAFMESLTEEVIGSIVEDYIERFYEETGWKRDEMMENAIQDCTGFTR